MKPTRRTSPARSRARRSSARPATATKIGSRDGFRRYAGIQRQRLRVREDRDRTGRSRPRSGRATSAGRISDPNGSISGRGFKVSRPQRRGRRISEPRRDERVRVLVQDQCRHERDRQVQGEPQAVARHAIAPFIRRANRRRAAAPRPRRRTASSLRRPAGGTPGASSSLRACDRPELLPALDRDRRSSGGTTIPTAGSIGSPFVRRPAPRSLLARPSASASTAREHDPPRSATIGDDDRCRGKHAVGVVDDARDRRPAPRPSVGRSRARRRSRGRRRPRPPLPHRDADAAGSAPRRRTSPRRRGAARASPRAGAASASMHVERVADRVPERLRHVGDRAARRAPPLRARAACTLPRAPSRPRASS